MDRIRDEILPFSGAGIADTPTISKATQSERDRQESYGLRSACDYERK